ncbi:MAG: aldehyde dehydrogenase family protein [Sciscionella sp.]|nr:aldehyde dehydrogenase family protein [Sciscionella sp.]
MDDRRELYIGGEWVTPIDGGTIGGTIEVENPATEQIIARVPKASTADVDRAVAAARAGSAEWSTSTPTERAAALRRLHDAVKTRFDALVDTIATEMGSPVRFAGTVQVPLPLTVIASYADLLDAGALDDEEIGNSLVAKESIGVVGAITPWNYPLHQLTNKIAPAIAAGCAVVVKPSELSPLTAYLLFDALHEAGLPAGVVNLVTGYGADVGEALAGHPDVDMVSFTGSVPAGRRVGELAGGGLKKVALELGGKSANVLLTDADLATAVKVGVANAFLNAGQTCSAWTRMVVPQAKYAEVLELITAAAAKHTVGDPHDPNTRIGPLVSARQRDRVLGFIRTGLAEGARAIVGGPDADTGQQRGHYVAPTVLADVHPDATVAQQEIFGPVLSVIGYADEADALRIANNSDYGLAGAVWSADRDRAIAFARKVRTGSVDINGGAFNPLAPFGGYKSSGVGRELGRHGLHEYLQTKAIQL